MLVDNIKIIRKFFTTFSYKEIKDLKLKASLIYRDAFSIIKMCSLSINDNQEALGKILIIIPKQVGKAPKRNYMRRIIKELFFKHQLYGLNCNFIYIVRQVIPYNTLDLLIQNIKKKIADRLVKNRQAAT